MWRLAKRRAQQAQALAKSVFLSLVAESAANENSPLRLVSGSIADTNPNVEPPMTLSDMLKALKEEIEDNDSETP